MFSSRRVLRLSRWLRLAALGGAVFALAYLCIEIPKHAGNVAPIWLANAVVLAVLLCTPKRRWPMVIAVGALGLLTADLAVGYSIGLSLGLSACNTAEIAGAALALSSLTRRPFERWRPRDCFKFGAVSVLVSSASAMMAMMILYPGQAPHVQDLILWMMADALGLLVLTPSLLILARSRKSLDDLRRDALIPFGFLIGGALLSFGQDRYPIQFLPAFALLFVAWRHRTIGAAIGLLILNIIATPLTMMELGPFSYTGNNLLSPILALQTYLAVCFFIALPVAAQSDRVRRMHHDLRRALVASREEVHAREEAEARYRLLAENGRDLIMQTGLDRLFSYVSPSVLPLTGYSQTEVVGRSPLLFLHPEDAAMVSAAFDGQILAAKPRETKPIQYRIRTRDGRVLWLESQPTALIDPETGAVLGASDVARDITARVAMEDELRTARTEALAAAQAKSDFLANMSHELRTPLTSVVGYTRLAAEQPELSALTRDYVERVGDASRALLCVVNDILDFSKLEAGQVTLTRGPTSAAKLARTTLELFAPQAAAKDIDLLLDCDLEDGLCLDLDPDRFRQILLNLVGNAVKFTDEGAVTLKVAFADDTLSVAVCDTGPGIPTDRQGQLFQRFSQIDGSLTRAHGGTGLGLAICKGLVEAMGGQIGLDSQPGQGASFHFTIPALISTQAAVETVREDVGVIPGLRVLVVDDHAANRELAILFLAGVGAEVFEAASGREAAEMAQRWPFDVILMDLRMPEMDGPATLAAIRETEGPNDATPILAFTADAEPGAEQRLDALGFQGVVAKPVEPAALIDAVVRASGYVQPQSQSATAHVR